MSFSRTGSFRHGWPICMQSECGNGSEWGIVRLTIDGSMFNTHPNFKDANGIQSSIKVNPFDWAYHSHTKTGHSIKDNYDLSVDADNGKEWMMASDDSMFGALPFNPSDYNFELEDRYAQPYSQAEDRLLTRAKHIPYADKYIKRVDIILMQIPNEEDYSDYQERQEEREAFYKAINNSRFKNITHLYDSVWSLEHGKEIPKEELLGNTSEVKPLYEYVCHMKGHRNSDGELAEWVIKSHETGKILSSHKSEQKAKEHLQQMHIFGESVEGEAACSHCGWSADGVEEYNGRLLCPYCLTQFKWLDEHRDPENGTYEKYDLVPRESKKSYKLIGESTNGNDMDKRIKIFMEGVSQLGLSKNQVAAIGKITNVCMEGISDEPSPELGQSDLGKICTYDVNDETPVVQVLSQNVPLQELTKHRENLLRAAPICKVTSDIEKYSMISPYGKITDTAMQYMQGEISFDPSDDGNVYGFKWTCLGRPSVCFWMPNDLDYSGYDDAGKIGDNEEEPAEF